tara:strand:+ start:297 stop:1487 length:1191 start_codon:yes stop_codon:yes gene_type:complete
MDLKKLIKENINNSIISEQQKIRGKQYPNDIAGTCAPPKIINFPKTKLQNEQASPPNQYHMFSVCYLVYVDSVPLSLATYSTVQNPSNNVYAYAHPNWSGGSINNPLQANILFYQAVGSPQIGESFLYQPMAGNQYLALCSHLGYDLVTELCMVYEGIYEPPLFGGTDDYSISGNPIANVSSGQGVIFFTSPSAGISTCTCGEDHWTGDFDPEDLEPHRCHPIDGCVPMPGGNFSNLQDCLDSGCEEPDEDDEDHGGDGNGEEPYDPCIDFSTLPQAQQDGCCGKCQNPNISTNDPCYQYCECCSDDTPPPPPSEDKVTCACCKNGMPISMQQMVPSNPGCIGAENTYYAGLGVTDCALSQVSGGPGPKCKKPSSINPDVVSVMVERFQKLANIKK